MTSEFTNFSTEYIDKIKTEPYGHHFKLLSDTVEKLQNDIGILKVPDDLTLRLTELEKSIDKIKKFLKL